MLLKPLVLQRSQKQLLNDFAVDVSKSNVAETSGFSNIMSVNVVEPFGFSNLIFEHVVKPLILTTFRRRKRRRRRRTLLTPLILQHFQT